MYVYVFIMYILLMMIVVDIVVMFFISFCNLGILLVVGVICIN